MITPGFEGLPVTGARTTTVVPAGYSGNATEITITKDVWTSAEMKLVIKVATRDPRKGEIISGLENFSRQPDPALFHPPANYTVNYHKVDKSSADPNWNLAHMAAAWQVNQIVNKVFANFSERM